MQIRTLIAVIVFSISISTATLAEVVDCSRKDTTDLQITLRGWAETAQDAEALLAQVLMNTEKHIKDLSIEIIEEQERLKSIQTKSKQGRDGYNINAHVRYRISPKEKAQELLERIKTEDGVLAYINGEMRIARECAK